MKVIAQVLPPVAIVVLHHLGCTSAAKHVLDVGKRREQRGGVGGMGGGYPASFTAVVVIKKTVVFLQCRDGARRLSTDQAYIACTKHKSVVSGGCGG